MHFRSHLALLGAIACVLVTASCVPTKKVAPTQVATDEEISSTIAADKSLATGIKGKVVLSADKAVAGAKVYASDQRLKQITEFGSATTDAQGAFAFRPIAANNVWFVQASFEGVTAATMVVPLQKKEVAVTMSVASSVATAGLVPLFTVAKPKPYILRYLDMSLYSALVSAVEKCIAEDKHDIQLAKTLNGLADPFDKMVKSGTSSGLEVKKAYEAIVADLKKKEALRQQGKTSLIKPPQETLPDTGSGSDPDAGGGTTDPGDTTDPGETDPEEGKKFDPVIGSLTEVPGVNFTSLRPVQLLSIAGQMLAPDGDRVMQLDALLKPNVLTMPAGISDVRAMALVGTKVVGVGKVGGKFSLVASSITGGAMPAPIELSGESVLRISSLAAYDGSHVLAVDEANHTLVKINVNDGKVTLYAGVPNRMGKTTTKKPAAEFELSGPTAIVKVGTAFYLTDTNNHRIVKISGDQIEPFAGSGVLGLAPGTLDLAKIETPTSLDYHAGEKKFYVVSSTRGAVYEIDEAADKVVALASEATKAFAGQDLAPNAQALVCHGGSVYVVSNQKLMKFTSP